MSARFEELDRQPTPMGEISVRRRLEPTLLIDVFEVKLGDEHLMSTLFTAAEIALADLGLAAVTGAAGNALDVAAGGLGLGFTARAALADPRVARLDVVEALAAVIDWHDRDLLPGAAELTGDDRCHLQLGDFFALVAAGEPFGPGAPAHYHAILLDIDHTPSYVLHPDHAPFYTEAGLTQLAERLHPGGVFALWSDVADDAFFTVAQSVFATCEAHEVQFPNHHTGGVAANVVYVATLP